MRAAPGRFGDGAAREPSRRPPPWGVVGGLVLAASAFTFVACEPSNAPMVGRNEWNRTLIVRYVIAGVDAGGYEVPPQSVAVLPTVTTGPPASAALLDDGCQLRGVAVFSTGSGSFDAGGQLFVDTHGAVGYTTERVDPPVVMAQPTDRCQGTFDPTDPLFTGD